MVTCKHPTSFGDVGISLFIFAQLSDSRSEQPMGCSLLLRLEEQRSDFQKCDGFGRTAGRGDTTLYCCGS